MWSATASPTRLHVHRPVPQCPSRAPASIGNAGVASGDERTTTRDYLLQNPGGCIDEFLSGAVPSIGSKSTPSSPKSAPDRRGLIAIPAGFLAAPTPSRWAFPLRSDAACGCRWGASPFPTLVLGRPCRGGISIALALSLPEGPARTTILAVTYVIVLFSVIVKGGTVGGLIRRLSPKAPESEGERETLG